jgi:hypothetical protein
LTGKMPMSFSAYVTAPCCQHGVSNECLVKLCDDRWLDDASSSGVLSTDHSTGHLTDMK